MKNRRYSGCFFFNSVLHLLLLILLLLFHNPHSAFSSSSSALLTDFIVPWTFSWTKSGHFLYWTISYKIALLEQSATKSRYWHNQLQTRAVGTISYKIALFEQNQWLGRGKSKHARLNSVSQDIDFEDISMASPPCSYRIGYMCTVTKLWFSDNIAHYATTGT